MMDFTGKSILVADDELGIRDLLRFTLEPIGFEVSTAADGEEALLAVQARSFDLVILDVHMPRLSGPEVLAKIKEIRPEQKVLVVSSSSDASLSFEHRVAEYGAMSCLFKPVELDELLGTIEQAFAYGGNVT